MVSTVMTHDGGGGTTREAPPPPPPTPQNLREADPATANRSVEQMTPEQQATLTEDVQAMPVAERDDLVNTLATKLEPEQLQQLEPVFGRDVVLEAVQTRSSAVVREGYAALTGANGRPAEVPPSGMPEDEQVAQAQGDYEERVANQGIVGHSQLTTLMTEHAGDPAYLAELVRLANDDGTLDMVVNPMYGGLYEKEGGAYTADAYIDDGDARRDAFATAVASAVDRGVLSQADVRALAVHSGGWQDVAARAGVEQVGATDATQATSTELDGLLDTQSDAQGDVDKLDEELGGLLAQAGPMTEEQQAAFIEAYRNDPEHKPTYDALIESSQALSDYMGAHRNEVLDAAVRDPDVAQQVHDAITTLARNGHGVEAMTLLAEIQRVPDSALAGAFEGFDDLSGDVLTDAASSAMSELLAQNDGSVSKAQADFMTLMSAFGQATPAWGGYKDFSDGQKLLEALVKGDYQAVDRAAMAWNGSKPLFRAFAAAGVVIGAVSAVNAGTNEEYLTAIEGLARSGENGARVVAGAMNALADSGRLAQYSGRFAGTAGFAARLAPALGLIASSASLVNSIREASDGNVGYAIAAFGDVLGVLGSALELTPAAPAGFIVSGIGAIISGIGSFVGEIINGHERREQIEAYLIEAGVDPSIADEMASVGSDLFDMAETLDMTPEQVQALLKANPDVALSPGHVGIITRVAEACGLQGGDVVTFVDKLAADNPDFAWDLFGIVSHLPTSNEQAQAFLRDYVENNYDSAIEYAQAQSPELFGQAAEQREAAVRDYQFDGFTTSYALALGNRLIDNTDPAYRAEMIRLLAEDGRLEMFAQELGPYGGDWGEASRAAISDALDAGVITREQADAALAHF